MIGKVSLKCALTSSVAGLLLAGCSDTSELSYSGEADMAVMESVAVADAAAPAEAPATGGEIPVSEPQIAYTYSLGFHLPLGSIKKTQQAHAEMCESRGPKVCRIISMRQANGDTDYASGSLRLVYVADKARAFSKELEKSTGEEDGELTASSMTGEDLSKQIVDTEARLKSRELLRERLMSILASRNGTVGELVEAERAVAQVNQEIDQARSWLKEMRGRVAFSEMTINYEAGARSPVGGFSSPIVSAWNSLGGVLGSVIAGIMIFLTAALPVAALLLALRWLLHRFGYRLRFWKTDLRTDT
ncbi:MAG: DUF4349 domain-containing protein [Pseudomonadota bacterium]|nr:DUF4349 domain-containing protein [Pseudomonadota bacterium]